MKMSLIVLSALAASFLLRRRSAALRHWVLAAGVACSAALPILSAAVPAWPLPFATPTAFTRYEDPFRDAESPSPTRPPVAVNSATVAAPVPPGTAMRGFNLGAALQSIWLAGTFVGLAILLTGVLRL